MESLKRTSKAKPVASRKKKPGSEVETVRSIAEKFSEINKYIESGKVIPAELSKNFVSCNLSDDPYSELE